MMKPALLSLLLLPGLAGADAVSEALASAQELDARVRALSAVHSPSVHNVQSARGELELLPPFLGRLAEDLASVHVGPADEVRAVGLDLNVRIETLKGTSKLDLNLLIERCRGISGELRRLEGLLPSLILALREQLGAQAGNIEAATGWKAPPTPTPQPGTVSQPGLPQPSPTPFFPILAPPPPQAQPTSFVPAGGPPPVIPATGPAALVPGGPQPPPPPAATPYVPQQGQPTPTPLPPLKLPLAILASVNGQKVYVANYHAGTVAVMDASSRRVVKQLPVGSRPTAMAQGGGLLVVANHGSANATLIETQGDTVLATLRCGEGPVDVAMSNDGKKAYVANQASGTLTVLDLARRATGKQIRVGAQAGRVSLPQNSRYAYVSLPSEDAVAVVDLDLEQVVATVSE